MTAMALLACGESVARAAPVDEQEQKRMEWARQQAVSRVLSAEEMREYLRCCGDDEARATENLPQLDKWTQEIGGWQAISLLSAATRLAEQRRRNEVSYQEYTDGKLTYEVTVPRIDLARAVEMRQGARFMPLVAVPEAPRPPAKPRSKSGQRRAQSACEAGTMSRYELKSRDQVYEDYMRRISAPVARRRSKRGQRRAAAKRWWVR